jgi:hypothetical protein
MEIHSDYKVIRTTLLSELEKDVNTYLNKGWQLQGGISTVMGHGDTQHYLQAVCIKREV